MAVKAILAASGKLTITEIATKLGVSHQAVSKMEHRPGFMAWVSAELGRATDEVFEAIVYRQAILALRGNLPSAEFIARVRGKIDRPGGSGGGTNVTVIVRV